MSLTLFFPLMGMKYKDSYFCDFSEEIIKFNFWPFLTALQNTGRADGKHEEGPAAATAQTWRMNIREAEGGWTVCGCLGDTRDHTKNMMTCRPLGLCWWEEEKMPDRVQVKMLKKKKTLINILFYIFIYYLRCWVYPWLGSFAQCK